MKFIQFSTKHQSVQQKNGEVSGKETFQLLYIGTSVSLIRQKREENKIKALMEVVAGMSPTLVLMKLELISPTHYMKN